MHGYDQLKAAGYEEIAVAGLSLRWCIFIEIRVYKTCKGYCNDVCTDDDENN